MKAILKTGKPLACISTLHSKKAFSFIQDRTRVILQFFTTIELYSGDVTSCCRKSKGFGSKSCDTSFVRQREAIVVREARTPILLPRKQIRNYTRTLSEVRIEINEKKAGHSNHFRHGEVQMMKQREQLQFSRFKKKLHVTSGYFIILFENFALFFKNKKKLPNGNTIILFRWYDRISTSRKAQFNTNRSWWTGLVKNILIY